jgi:hypothetical protein
VPGPTPGKKLRRVTPLPPALGTRTVRPSGEDVCSVSRSPVPPGSLVPMSNTPFHAEGRATRPPACQGDLHLLPMAACVSSGCIAAGLRGGDACHLPLPVHERTIR